MRGRFDLFGRLLLILVGSVLLLGATSVTLILVHDELRPRRPSTFPRVRQAAGLIDLAVGPSAPSRQILLRAANGSDLSAVILATPPPPGELQRAPKLTAKLKGFMRTTTPVMAYTDPRYRPIRRGSPIEGFLARAIARLPDGSVLVLTTNATGDQERPRLFGLPASLWMGVLAVIVVLLALWLTARETRPLRDLVRATQRFDGTAVTTAMTLVGAADIRRTAQAVTAMQRRVIDLLGERSLMIGAISHDLRTLLTRLRLRVVVLDDPARSKLEADLDGMDAMLADALAFARGTTGSVRDHVDLADLAAAEVIEREMRDTAPEITTDLHDAPCLGDAHALRRVIANLIDNARKYGRGRIHLSVTRSDRAVHLSVEDNGPGIPLDQRSAVLAPYHRGDDPQHRRLAGSGLGLAIVQQIMRAHGGLLTISDSKLGGAKVAVQLDCDRASGDSANRKITDVG